jgi:hypothetical protein
VLLLSLLLLLLLLLLTARLLLLCRSRCCCCRCPDGTLRRRSLVKQLQVTEQALVLPVVCSLFDDFLPLRRVLLQQLPSVVAAAYLAMRKIEVLQHEQVQGSPGMLVKVGFHALRRLHQHRAQRVGVQ